VRTLYEKFINTFPDNPIPWIKFGEFEKDLEEYERFEKVFELAIDNNQMNMPETVWRAYLDNQMELKNYDKARDLYERLLERSKHIKIWVAYAQFEASTGDRAACRKILEKAEKHFLENPDLKEERAMLLEAWKDLEESFGDAELIEAVTKKLPKKVRKRRKIKLQDDNDEDLGTHLINCLGFEEYYDYIFPEEGVHQKNLKFL
jgi:crooked neck